MNLYVKMRPKPASRPRVTKRGTYNSSDYTAFKKAFKSKWVSKHKKVLENAVSVRIEFFFAIPKSWNKAKKANAGLHTSRPDIDNLIKSVLDALNGVAYKDDGQVAEVYVRKQYFKEDGIFVSVEEMR